MVLKAVGRIGRYILGPKVNDARQQEMLVVRPRLLAVCVCRLEGRTVVILTQQSPYSSQMM